MAETVAGIRQRHAETLAASDETRAKEASAQASAALTYAQVMAQAGQSLVSEIGGGDRRLLDLIKQD